MFWKLSKGFENCYTCMWLLYSLLGTVTIWSFTYFWKAFLKITFSANKSTVVCSWLFLTNQLLISRSSLTDSKYCQLWIRCVKKENWQLFVTAALKQVQYLYPATQPENWLNYTSHYLRTVWGPWETKFITEHINQIYERKIMNIAHILNRRFYL